MFSSAVFMAAATVAMLFLLGFVVAWLIFKTIQHFLTVPAETLRPYREDDTVGNLKMETERTRLAAETLRLRTEEVKLKVLESHVGAMTGGVKNDRDNTDPS